MDKSNRLTKNHLLFPRTPPLSLYMVNIIELIIIKSRVETFSQTICNVGLPSILIMRYCPINIKILLQELHSTIFAFYRQFCLLPFQPVNLQIDAIIYCWKSYCKIFPEISNKLVFTVIKGTLKIYLVWWLNFRQFWQILINFSPVPILCRNVLLLSPDS